MTRISCKEHLRLDGSPFAVRQASQTKLLKVSSAEIGLQTFKSRLLYNIRKKAVLPIPI